MAEPSSVSHQRLKSSEAHHRIISYANWFPSRAGWTAEACPLRHITDHIIKATQGHSKRKKERTKETAALCIV